MKPTRVTYLLLLASGFSALIYQVVWARELGLVFGQTIYAVSAVLTAFMGGLALGSHLIGRALARQGAGAAASPLRLYAWLELGVAAVALAFPLLTIALDPVYAWLYRAAGDHFYLFNIARFALATLVLLVPTTFMGGTLPAMSAWAAQGAGPVRPEPGDSRGPGAGEDSATVGRLYAANTIGATLGCLAAGFVLIERLGMLETQMLAAALNAVAGIVALWMARAKLRPTHGFETIVRAGSAGLKTRPTYRPTGSAGLKTRPTYADEAAAPACSLRLLLILFGVSGCVALIYEVVWTRALVFYTGTTTYAFTSMLAVYLAGLALGSAVGAVVVLRLVRLERAFAWLQIGIAIAAGASLSVLASTAGAIERVAPPDASWRSLAAGNLLKAAVTMFVPTLLLGALFPIGVRLAEAVTAIGDRVGRLYAANTLGAIMGAAIGGYVLIPGLGMTRTLLVCATTNLIVAVAATGLAPAAHAEREGARHERVGVGPHARWTKTGPAIQAGLKTRPTSRSGLKPCPRAAMGMRHATVVIAGVAVALLLWGGVVPSARALHRPEGSERLLYYVEGSSATVSVLQEVGGTKTLYIDRVPVAGTDPIMLTDQKSLAHVPMLLHPDPRQVLTVGFGSGGAAWSFARYDRLRAIDCVEIDPAVFGAAPFLQESNHRVWDDPRFRLVLEDARSYLAYTDRQYDVISTDCTDLRYKSNAALYTTDYFGLCRRRLRPGGIVVVWMPLGGLGEEVFKLALRTFRAVFPHATLWYLTNYPTHYALLVGTPEPLRIDLDRALDRLAERDVQQDLAEIRLDSPAKILTGLLLDERAYGGFVGDGPVNRDRYPTLEFVAPRRAYRFALSQNLTALARRQSDVRALLVDRRSGREAAAPILASLDRAAKAAPALLAGHAIYQRGTFEYEAAIAEYHRAGAFDPDDAGIRALVASADATRRMWIDEYERRRASGRADVADRVALGSLYLDAEKFRDAERVLEEARALAPGDAAAARALAAVLARRRRADEAIAAYERALRLDERSAEAHNDLWLLYLGRGDRARAGAEFSRALALDPLSAAAHHNLGTTRVAGGDWSGAESAYRRAIALDPRLVEAYGNLAALYVRTGRRHEAVAALEALLAVDPAVEVARKMLDDLR